MSAAYLVLLLFLCGFIYVGAPHCYIRLLRKVQERRVRSRSNIVLTFDDGPGFRLTPALLDLLAEHNVRATFFMLGRNIRGREHIVKAVADQGHEIGSHSYDHLHSWKVWPTRALADIREGQHELERVLPLPDHVPVRPPYGKVNLLTLLFLLYKRAPICTWTLDTRDTWPASGRDCQEIADAVRRSGSVISLAHDFDRSESDVDEYVLSTVRAILVSAKEAGLHFVTMTEALSRRKRSLAMSRSPRTALAADIRTSS